MQCPSCGASFRGHPPACPGCGIELWWDGEDAEDDNEEDEDDVDRPLVLHVRSRNQGDA